MVNDDVFEWDDLPQAVAVFGPGVIGLELGQSLHRLGVKVKVFGLGGQVGPLTDPDVMAYANRAFQQEFYLDADVKVESMKRIAGDKVEIQFINQQGELETFIVDYVLAATGRRPNVDKLALDNTDVALDERGVPKADHYTLQTSVPQSLLQAMPATKSRCCMKPQIKDALPAITQAASLTFARVYAARQFLRCFLIHKSLWSGKPISS